MEFLFRDCLLLDLRNRLSIYEEFWSCWYLWIDKDDVDVYGRFCLCNFCEYGEGLRNMLYLNL